MGLGILSKSDLDYSWSYSGIHYVRYMAYRTIGGQMDYRGWHEGNYGSMFPDPNPPAPDPLVEQTLREFGNLLWHSDCDGTYTLRGRIKPYNTNQALKTGNSKGLLKELQRIKDELPHDDPMINERDWRVFNMLYDLVKDVVENHDGRLEFC